jgi:hypothetical protein
MGLWRIKKDAQREGKQRPNVNRNGGWVCISSGYRLGSTDYSTLSYPEWLEDPTLT